MKFDKSPLNYIGNKYKLLPQLVPLFPQDIGIAVDLFAGGCDVITNIDAKYKVANDRNERLINLVRWIKETPVDALTAWMDSTIELYGLSKTNQEAYYRLREDYNERNNTAPMLFACICYCFNNQMRFNKQGKFNSAFGKNRSSFNDAIRGRLEAYHNNLQDVALGSSDFRLAYAWYELGEGDFVYCDPPYLISSAFYNSSKEGFNGWNEKDDKDLFNLLDRLNQQGVKFGLSNLMCHKGQVNEGLLEWSKKYKTYELDKSYSNCVYCWKPTDAKTQEVYITNV